MTAGSADRNDKNKLKPFKLMYQSCPVDTPVYIVGCFKLYLRMRPHVCFACLKLFALPFFL